MKVLIDVQALQSPLSAERGIGRYARGLVRALRNCRPAWNITLIENDCLECPRGVNDFRRSTFKPPLALASDTTEVNARFYGDWLAALKANPFGYVTLAAAIVLVVVVGWALARRRAMPSLTPVVQSRAMKALIVVWLAFGLIRLVVVATG